jgi:hypothetical protein
VDTGTLATLLQSRDHQIIFGRRGTGKTHALLYLADIASKQQDLVAYVDLRSIGSSGGLYADPGLPFAERATRLLIDTIAAVSHELLSSALNQPTRLGALEGGLDRLATATGEVRVVSGTTAGDATRHRVHFGAATAALQQIVAALAPNRLWILLDEWSTIPLDLQPFLADLLRRAVLPVQKVTVKIAAIEHRSIFQLAPVGGDYIGIELGADVAADLNLDDFMVFDNNRERAVEFFRDLLFRHFLAVASETDAAKPASPEEFVRQVFTQRTPFEDLVNAAEGVPRDAINVAALSAQRAVSDKIAATHVRQAAAAWYQRDKQGAVAPNQHAHQLLYWIIDNVIAHRRARAFLLRAGLRHRLIDALFDARVLHVAKRGISAHDQPGVRYDAYKIDYGCYVDLLSTQRAPQGLLPLDTPGGGMSHIDVPPDDYRAIRRAILEIEEFEKQLAQGAP